MALHNDLPIYRSGIDLLALGISLQQDMPRAVKRSLGGSITDHCMAMLNLMALANASMRGQRAAYLEQLLEHQRAVQALLRVAHGCRAISTKRWAAAIEILDTVGRQAGGWLKSANKAPAA